jgi:large subunit ribosomal protein L17
MVLGRTVKQRWHLFRNLVTQLVEHERITTTQAKAKGLHKYAERIIKNAKKSAEGLNSGTN